MLIVMIIMYFLPFGYTKKGKIIIVMVGFLLALGGLAAAASFSMWQALLMLLVLIFFAAYIMEKRLGKVLYAINNSMIEEWNDKDDLNLDLSKLEIAADHDMDSNEDMTAPAVFKHIPKVINSDIIPELEQKEDQEFLITETTDEDISFLNSRSLNIIDEESKESEETEYSVDYLSEIEELLEDQLDERQDSNEAVVPKIQELTEEDEIPVLTFDDKPLKKVVMPDINAAEDVEGIEEISPLSFQDKGGR
jgi:hypothetical protein